MLAANPSNPARQRGVDRRFSCIAIHTPGLNPKAVCSKIVIGGGPTAFGGASSARERRRWAQPAQGECQLEPQLAIATVLFMRASIVRLPPSVHDTCDHTFAPPGIAGTAARPMRTSSSTTCCSPLGADSGADLGEFGAGFVGIRAAERGKTAASATKYGAAGPGLPPAEPAAPPAPRPRAQKSQPAPSRLWRGRKPWRRRF